MKVLGREILSPCVLLCAANTNFFCFPCFTNIFFVPIINKSLNGRCISGAVSSSPVSEPPQDKLFRRIKWPSIII